MKKEDLKKLAKAEKLGVKTLTWENFLNLIK